MSGLPKIGGLVWELLEEGSLYIGVYFGLAVVGNSHVLPSCFPTTPLYTTSQVSP